MCSRLSALSSHTPVLVPHRGHHSPSQDSGSQCALHRVCCPHAPAQGGASALTSQRTPGDLPQWVSEGLQAAPKGTCSSRQGPPAEASGQARPPGDGWGLQSWATYASYPKPPGFASSGTQAPPTPTPTCLNCSLVTSCVKKLLQARKEGTGAEWGAHSFPPFWPGARPAQAHPSPEPQGPLPTCPGPGLGRAQ